MDIKQFQDILWQKGNELYRDMPWRQDTRPYYILVSELMLQQTQVDRVVPKFESPLAEVVKQWQGLGYNRRAKFLHDSVKQIVEAGSFPSDEQTLVSLPGVGKNTAGAIRVYAFNEPSLFIETNVRAVYIHHFFGDSDAVSDKEIEQILLRTIDYEHPREFYWAVMDYGNWLKKQGVKPSRSIHYRKQAVLQGSVREVRGQLLTLLAEGNQSM